MERRSNVGLVDKLGTSKGTAPHQAIAYLLWLLPPPCRRKEMTTSRTREAESGWENFNAPAKVYKIGASLGLSALGSISGVNCRFIIDTKSDITIVQPVLCKSVTTLQPVAGHISTFSGEMTPIQVKDGQCYIRVEPPCYQLLVILGLSLER